VRHEGVIGVYDARANYKRIDEFPTFGIGPHDLALLPDGKTLVVATAASTSGTTIPADASWPTSARISSISIGKRNGCWSVPSSSHNIRGCRSATSP
jgi:hypothetical protein